MHPERAAFALPFRCHWTIAPLLRYPSRPIALDSVGYNGSITLDAEPAAFQQAGEPSQAHSRSERQLTCFDSSPVENETPPIVEARPGHADYSGMLKYATDDLRNILERSSARNTASLVAVGAICRGLLAECGIRVMSHVAMLGGIRVDLTPPVDYA